MLLSFFMIHLKCCYRYCRMVQCLLKSNHLVIKVLIRFEAWDWRGPDLISTSHSGNIVLQIYNYTGLWYTSLFPKIFLLHLQYLKDGCKWLDTYFNQIHFEATKYSMIYFKKLFYLAVSAAVWFLWKADVNGLLEVHRLNLQSYSILQ